MPRCEEVQFLQHCLYTEPKRPSSNDSGDAGSAPGEPQRRAALSTALCSQRSAQGCTDGRCPRGDTQHFCRLPVSCSHRRKTLLCVMWAGLGGSTAGWEPCLVSSVWQLSLQSLGAAGLAHSHAAAQLCETHGSCVPLGVSREEVARGDATRAQEEVHPAHKSRMHGTEPRL